MHAIAIIIAPMYSCLLLSLSFSLISLIYSQEMYLNVLLQADCSTLWKWFLKERMMCSRMKDIVSLYQSAYRMFQYFLHPIFFLVFQTSRNSSKQGDGWERGHRWMWCHCWERGRSQYSLFFCDLMLLSEPTDIFSKLSRFSCSSILSGFCWKALFSRAV